MTWYYCGLEFRHEDKDGEKKEDSEGGGIYALSPIRVSE
jgi:hypothetical protein